MIVMAANMHTSVAERAFGGDPVTHSTQSSERQHMHARNVEHTCAHMWAQLGQLWLQQGGGHSEASGGRCDGESATEPRPVTVAGGGKEVRGDVTAFSHAVRRLEWE